MVLEGKTLSDKLDDVTKDSMYTICYTSGTTGKPKGAMLSHENFVSGVGAMQIYDKELRFEEDDVYISYLPLAHSFERFLLSAAMSCKVKYGIYSGDVFRLKEDLAMLKPTLMVSVPRLYNKFYEGIKQKIGELPAY